MDHVARYYTATQLSCTIFAGKRPGVWFCTGCIPNCRSYFDSSDYHRGNTVTIIIKPCKSDEFNKFQHRDSRYSISWIICTQI